MPRHRRRPGDHSARTWRSSGKETTDACPDRVGPRSRSQVIKKGFETVTIATVDGKTVTGLLVEEDADRVVLRDPARGTGKLVTILKTDIDERATIRGPSIMPAGLVNGLTSRQQFLDLIRYLREIADGGPDVRGPCGPTRRRSRG